MPSGSFVQEICLARCRTRRWRATARAQRRHEGSPRNEDDSS